MWQSIPLEGGRTLVFVLGVLVGDVDHLLVHVDQVAVRLPRLARQRVQRFLPIGTVLNLRTTTSQKCAAVPRRARI